MCTLYPLPELSSVRFAALFHSHFRSARGRSLLRGFRAAALALLLLPLLLPQTAATAETIAYGSNCGDLTCMLDTETGA